jgi:hypothetical protein
MVRALRPRRVRSTIVALGVGSADPKLLHVHPNTLVTLAWLAYSPRSEAHVVGAASGREIWGTNLPRREFPSYFIFASCGRFDPISPFAQILGDAAVRDIALHRPYADFAYVFMDAKGQPLDLTLPNPQTTLSSEILRRFSKRPDARVVLVGGDEGKLESIRLTLSSQLCNTLITDESTARALLSR